MYLQIRKPLLLRQRSPAILPRNVDGSERQRDTIGNIIGNASLDLIQVADLPSIIRPGLVDIAEAFVRCQGRSIVASLSDDNERQAHTVRHSRRCDRYKASHALLGWEDFVGRLGRPHV